MSTSHCKGQRLDDQAQGLVWKRGDLGEANSALLLSPKVLEVTGSYHT